MWFPSFDQGNIYGLQTPLSTERLMKSNMLISHPHITMKRLWTPQFKMSSHFDNLKLCNVLYLDLHLLQIYRIIFSTLIRYLIVLSVEIILDNEYSKYVLNLFFPLQNIILLIHRSLVEYDLFNFCICKNIRESNIEVMWYCF